jgi:hypothetical protein
VPRPQLPVLHWRKTERILAAMSGWVEGVARLGWSVSGLVALLATACLSACGEEDAAPLPEPTAQLPPGARDIEPLEREQRPVADLEPENADATNADDLDAYAEFLDALDREQLARCGCSFGELGHDSAEVCFESRREPALVRTCELGAFPAFADELAPRYTCLARARNGIATCIEERGCSALEECQVIRDAARGSCGPLSYAEVEFESLHEGCQRATRLGLPSGCPDSTSIGSALGTRVIAGDSTGRGDDFTLSCHWDFEGFEAADVTVEWQAPATGTYRFGTENSDFATQLGVLDGCGGAELACSSPGGASFGSAEITLQLAAEQRVLIVLEGYHVLQTGYYALSVTQLE